MRGPPWADNPGPLLTLLRASQTPKLFSLKNPLKFSLKALEAVPINFFEKDANLTTLFGLVKPIRMFGQWPGYQNQKEIKNGNCHQRLHLGTLGREVGLEVGSLSRQGWKRMLAQRYDKGGA
jgi:hypothetical protein